VKLSPLDLQSNDYITNIIEKHECQVVKSDNKSTLKTAEKAYSSRVENDMPESSESEGSYHDVQESKNMFNSS
jgi:hypothetical protein